jgi:O-acetyl-ADP-ribose deacetylase
MIEVRVGRLEDMAVEALLRPVAFDFSPGQPGHGRFHRAAGPGLAEQCDSLGELPVGSAVITAGGDLPAPFVVHAAVRSANDNVTPTVVRQALLNALRRVEEWGIATVAVAPFGTGAGQPGCRGGGGRHAAVLAQHCRASAHLTRLVLVAEDDYQRTALSAAVARHAPDLSS